MYRWEEHAYVDYVGLPCGLHMSKSGPARTLGFQRTLAKLSHAFTPHVFHVPTFLLTWISFRNSVRRQEVIKANTCRHKSGKVQIAT